MATLKLARIIAAKAARAWLSTRAKEQERDLDLNELVRIRVPGLRAQRSIERQFEQLADSVAVHLDPILNHEFESIESGNKQAAFDATIAAFKKANLSDHLVFAVDASPEKLYQKIISASPPDRILGEDGEQLYLLLVRECCVCYIKIIRSLPPFTGRAVSELLERTTALIGEVNNILERLPPAAIFSPNSTNADSEFERIYMDLVASELDEIELLSVIPGATLNAQLSVAYISLSVSAGDGTSNLQRRWWPEFGDRRRLPNISLPIDEALGHQRRTLVRGEAGSGKTTLLRWIAVTASRRQFTGALNSWNGLVPFVIKLRRYSDGSFPYPAKFIDSVAQVLSGLMPTGWVERVLNTGRGLILIDGVDELAEEDRDAAKAWIRRLAKSYPENRLIVTSRPAVVSAFWLAWSSFRSVIIEPMRPSAQETFVHSWHEAVRKIELQHDPGELDGYESSLVKAFNERSELRALAETPLLAAMICALNLYKAKQLPRNRMELYAMATELLLQRDVQRDVPSSKKVLLSLPDKKHILSDLAWRLSDNNLTELDVSKAIEYVGMRIARMPSVGEDAKLVFDYLLERSGLLREPSEGRVDFIHRTFQEYLASMEATTEDRIGNLVGRSALPQWRETIIMAAGHCTTRQSIELITGIKGEIEGINQHSLQMLIASCMETLTSIPPEISGIVDGCLAAFIPPDNGIDAVLLAQAGPIVLQKLPSWLDDLPRAKADATIRTAAMIGGQQALEFLATVATRTRNQGVVFSLFDAWEYFDSEIYEQRVLAFINLRRFGARVKIASQLESLPRLGAIDRIEIGDSISFEDHFFDVIAQIKRLRQLNVANFGGRSELMRLLFLPGLEAIDISHGGTFMAGNGIEMPLKLKALTLSAWNQLPDFEQVKLPSRLEQLRLGRLANGFHGKSLVDCGQLRRLALEIKGQVNNLDVLSGTKVAYLELVGSAEFHANSADVGVTTQTERNLELPSIEFLKELREIRHLTLRGLSAGIDLSPIGSLPLLHKLDLRDARGELDLSSLRHLRASQIFVSSGQPIVGAKDFGERIVVS